MPYACPIFAPCICERPLDQKFEGGANIRLSVATTCSPRCLCATIPARFAKVLTCAYANNTTGPDRVPNSMRRPMMLFSSVSKVIALRML